MSTFRRRLMMQQAGGGGEGAHNLSISFRKEYSKFYIIINEIEFAEYIEIPQNGIVKYFCNDTIKIIGTYSNASYFSVYANTIVYYNGRKYNSGELIYANVERAESITLDLYIPSLSIIFQETLFNAHDYNGYTTSLTITDNEVITELPYSTSLRSVWTKINDELYIKFNVGGTAHWTYKTQYFSYMERDNIGRNENYENTIATRLEVGEYKMIRVKFN